MLKQLIPMIGLFALGALACERSPRASDDHGKGAHPDTTGTDLGGTGMGPATETGVTGMTGTIASSTVGGSRGAGGAGTAGVAAR